MATVNIAFARAGQRGSFGYLSVLSAHPRAVENITSGITSIQSAGSAIGGEVLRIVTIGGGIYIRVGRDPTAAIGSGYLLRDGDVLDLGGLQDGDKVAVINA